MVKRGGTKRKAEIKRITDKNSKATTFTKRRDGLFSKAAQLCVLGDAQIAILATPSSSNSNVSFFSFGHSSVDSLVSAYLSGQRPVPPVREESKEMREDIGICMARKDLGLGYWWEDEKLVTSKNPDEIMQAMESIKVLLRDAERLLDEDSFGFNQRKGLLKDASEVDDLLPQTLISTEWSDMDLEELLSDEHHEIEAVSENSCSNNNNSMLLPAGGKLDDGQNNLFDLDLADVDLDTIFEGLTNLDADLVASLLT